MDTRRFLATLGLAAAALAAHAVPAHAAVADGLVLHDAAETLRDFCQRDEAGTLWLVLPSGVRFSLIESVDDPAIANHGDGAFHPFEPAVVAEALREVRFDLDGVRADVFMLPFPRRGGLESAAAPGVIMLSPGVWPVSVEQQHAEFVHELGHVVQYTLMPDADAARWDRYRDLRGIDDATVYTATGMHADRPHEIFAEDFRALFGGATANYSGTIENPTLTYPTLVPGLESFFRDLVGTRLAGILVRPAANPARAIVRFEGSTFDAGALDIVDVTGRRLATVRPVRTAAGAQWTWDRRDLRGERVGPGIVFARPRGTAGAGVRVVLAP